MEIMESAIEVIKNFTLFELFYQFASIVSVQASFAFQTVWNCNVPAKDPGWRRLCDAQVIVGQYFVASRDEEPHGLNGLAALIFIPGVPKKLE